MCNLYSMTKNQAVIRQLSAVTKDSTGNLPSMPLSCGRAIAKRLADIAILRQRMDIACEFYRAEREMHDPLQHAC